MIKMREILQMIILSLFLACIVAWMIWIGSELTEQRKIMEVMCGHWQKIADFSAGEDEGY